MPDTSSVTFPVGSRLEAGYLPAEDRLVLLAHTPEAGRRALLISRRMLRLVLDNIVRVMERTHAASGRTPTDQQAAVLEMEHLGALAAPPPPSPAATEGAEAAGEGVSAGGMEASGGFSAPPDGWWLAVEAKFRAEPDRLTIGFLGPRRHVPGAPDGTALEPVCAVSLDRGDSHRVLAMLHRKAHEAGWGLDSHAAWLTGAAVSGAGSVMN